MTIEHAERDGRPVVVKHTDWDPSLEAEGLAALADAGGAVVEVIEVGADHLVLADLSDAGPASRSDWEAFGAMLAEVHATTGPHHGWTRDNVLGAVAQPNEPHQDWPTFFWDQRIAPHLEVLPDGVSHRIRRSRAVVHDRLDHGPARSLVHGDLWAGNVLGGRWMIDPAVAWSDRELDLAFAAVFGGLPEVMFEAYDAAWPRDDGWRDREPILQLYHLMVHVRMFGAAYVPAVIERLDRAGL